MGQIAVPVAIADAIAAKEAMRNAIETSTLTSGELDKAKTRMAEASKALEQAKEAEAAAKAVLVAANEEVTRAGMTDDDDGDEQLERAEAAQAEARGHHDAAKSDTASKTAEFSAAEAALQVATSDAQRAAAVLTDATEKAEKTSKFKAFVEA